MSAADAASRRRRGLRNHVLVALATIMLLIAVNFATGPGYPWWMWVAVAWGAPLAVHVAWASGVFGRGE